jgi:hypothetical protein
MPRPLRAPRYPCATLGTATLGQRGANSSDATSSGRPRTAKIALLAGRDVLQGALLAKGLTDLRDVA